MLGLGWAMPRGGHSAWQADGQELWVYQEKHDVCPRLLSIVVGKGFLWLMCSDHWWGKKNINPSIACELYQLESFPMSQTAIVPWFFAFLWCVMLNTDFCLLWHVTLDTALCLLLSIPVAMIKWACCFEGIIWKTGIFSWKAIGCSELMGPFLWELGRWWRVRWAVEALAVSERSRGQSRDNLMKDLCMVVMLIKKQHPGDSTFPVMDWNLELKPNENPFFSMLFSSRIYHHNRNEVHYYLRLLK